MLILTRKANESIVIGSSVEILVIGVKNGRVKLGFSAPPEISIQRNEIRGQYHAGSGNGSDMIGKAVVE